MPGDIQHRPIDQHLLLPRVVAVFKESDRQGLYNIGIPGTFYINKSKNPRFPSRRRVVASKN